MNNHQIMPEEILIRLFVNGSFFAKILCTPINLKELVIGWLFSQKVIESLDEIHTLGVCDEMTDVSVKLSHDIEDKQKFDPILSSGCSGGEINSTLYSGELKEVKSNVKIEIKKLQKILTSMFSHLKETSHCSGVHCASLSKADNQSKMFFAIDIGRHNAVDKVIGAGLLNEIDFSSYILSTSGRISSDMILKAINAGIPIAISPRSITSMAADLAVKACIGVAGRFSKKNPIIAGKTDRFIGIDTKCQHFSIL